VAGFAEGILISVNILVPARLPALSAERTKFTVPNASAVVELVAYAAIRSNVLAVSHMDVGARLRVERLRRMRRLSSREVR